MIEFVSLRAYTLIKPVIHMNAEFVTSGTFLKQNSTYEPLFAAVHVTAVLISCKVLLASMMLQMLMLEKMIKECTSDAWLKVTYWIEWKCWFKLKKRITMIIKRIIYYGDVK